MSINYEIVDPSAPQTTPFPTLRVIPLDCIQTYTYEIVDASTGAKPAFATTTIDGIQIETDDESDIGNYQLELLITPDGPNEINPPLIVEYDLKIVGCIYDTIEVGMPIGEVVYQISSGAVIVNGDFVNKYAGDCPFDVDYSLI